MVHDEAEEFLDRLDEVEERLGEHAEGGAANADRRTAPDAGSGETWEWGQVWAHLGEFIPYWVEQARHVAAEYRGEPVPFGRVKSNPERIAAIERDRATAVPALWQRLQSQIEELRTFLQQLSDDDWAARGAHQTLGVMAMPTIVDEFLVGHLEQHVEQLDGLSSGR